MNAKYMKPLIMIATLGVTITAIYYGGGYIKRKFFNKDKKNKEGEEKAESNEKE